MSGFEPSRYGTFVCFRICNLCLFANLGQFETVDFKLSKDVPRVASFLLLLLCLAFISAARHNSSLKPKPARIKYRGLRSFMPSPFYASFLPLIQA